MKIFQMTHFVREISYKWNLIALSTRSSHDLIRGRIQHSLTDNTLQIDILGFYHQGRKIYIQCKILICELSKNTNFLTATGQNVAGPTITRLPVARLYPLPIYPLLVYQPDSSTHRESMISRPESTDMTK